MRMLLLLMMAAVLPGLGSALPFNFLKVFRYTVGCLVSLDAPAFVMLLEFFLVRHCSPVYRAL